MLKLHTCTIVLATSLMASAAVAAMTTSTQTAANHDYGKLSVQGANAIHDVRLARLAIFQGQINKAKTYTDDAEAAIAKAQTDDAVFVKAESELRPPSNMAHSSTGPTPSTNPIRWIPVDGSMTLGEDFVVTPEKSASVAKASEQLKKGQKEKAMEALKLANIDVNLVLKVAPLEKTRSGIREAALLMRAAKYYEANQALKGVEDGMRYDIETVQDAPKTAASTSISASTSLSFV